MFLDLANFFFLTFIILLMFVYYKIPIQYYILIFFHYILIFGLNDFLFPIYYMGDQINYLNTTSLIRENLDFFDIYKYRIGNVAHASFLFSLFPIPFIESVYSLAMINTTLYSLIFVFLYKKKVLNKYGIIFYFSFPSLALYTGVGLRDTWILFFMIFSIYYFINGRTFLSILISLPLLFIKFQNFVIFIVAMVVYKIMTMGKQTLIYFFIKIILFISLFQLLVFLIGIEYLDYYRRAFFIEDGGIFEEYIPLKGAFDALVKSTIGAFEFLLRPLPWQASGILQLIQSIENLIVFYLLFLLIKKQLQVKDKKVMFFIIYLFVAMSIYGLLISNFGTSVRYRYTFIVIFVIFTCYYLYIKKDTKKDKTLEK